MDDDFFDQYDFDVNDAEVEYEIDLIKSKLDDLRSIDALKTCFSCIDLTSLNTTDTLETGKTLAEKVNRFQKDFPYMPNVGAICIYPSLINEVRKNLKAKDVKIATVTAGFPHSQTFLDIKLSESQMAVEEGADEVDIVISVGRFLEEDYETVYNEIAQVKDAIGDAHLKVILETGALPTYSSIRLAALIAMEAGADFVKTSTGKINVGATPQAVYVMAQAVKDYYDRTERMVGIKPAGGVVTTNDALTYYGIMKTVLGEDWLNNEYFRLGASRLANNLLSDIKEEPVEYF